MAKSFNKESCKKLYNDGYHITEVADMLGYDLIQTYNAITSGLHGKVVEDEERSIMIELRNRGYSYKRIGNELHRSASCVRDRVNAPAKKPIHHEYPMSPKQLAKCKKLYIAGKDLPYICRKLNGSFTPVSVKRRLIQCGVYKKGYTMSVPLTFTERCICKNMRAHGDTIADICYEIGRPFFVVARFLNDFNNKADN